MKENKLDTREAAKYLGLKPNTLEVWRCKKKGPKYSKLGGKVSYDKNDLESYFASQSVHTVDTVPQLQSQKQSKTG